MFRFDRTRQRRIVMVRLKTGQIVPLIDGGMTGNVSDCIHPTQPQIYFHDGQVLSRIRTDTMKTANQGDGINLGPELTIDDNEETAFYTSFLTGTKQEPKANLYQIGLRPFVEDLMKDAT